jgi:NifB/MoaA-like Fe-S oxidoreductase
MMGHTRQRDHLNEKLQFFRENGIDMHTQIVLVPGFNDGDALVKTIDDLYAMYDAVQSVSIVPVGLTSHRQGLQELRHVTPAEADALIDQIETWQDHSRADIGSGFVYGSDELYLLAGREFPQEDAYDGFPLMENGVGMCRDFLDEFEFQLDDLRETDLEPTHITMVTGTLASSILTDRIAPVLNEIPNLTVDVVTAENRIFGPAVTVSGLLGYKCIRSALGDRKLGDLVLLPPDCINYQGDFLDNVAGRNSPDDLAEELGTPVRIFAGDWLDALVPGWSRPHE